MLRIAILREGDLVLLQLILKARVMLVIYDLLPGMDFLLLQQDAVTDQGRPI
jgi:hypothetical protein